MTDPVEGQTPQEPVAENLLDHEYDGIREYDDPFVRVQCCAPVALWIGQSRDKQSQVGCNGVIKGNNFGTCTGFDVNRVDDLFDSPQVVGVISYHQRIAAGISDNRIIGWYQRPHDRKPVHDALHADFVARAAFVADIHLAGRVFAHKDRSQGGHGRVVLDEVGDLIAKRFAKGGREGFSVEQLSRHGNVG